MSKVAKGFMLSCFALLIVVGIANAVINHNDDVAIVGTLNTTGKIEADGWVNTHAGRNTATQDANLIFGDFSGNFEQLYWKGSAGEFRFTDDLRILGNLEIDLDLFFEGAGATKDARIMANPDGDVIIRLGD